MTSILERKECALPSIATLTGFAVLLLCSCTTFSFSSTQAASKEAKQRKPAPAFTLRDANGSSVSLSDYRGKVVLLNFWATWCGPCKMEIPWFIDMEQQYKSKGFEVVGVSMDEDGWTAIKPYIAEEKVNYRVLLGDDSIGDLYGGVEALPTSFVIDRDGRIAYVHVGLAEKNEYVNEIQGLLGEKQASSSLRGMRSLAATLHTSPAK